MGLITGNAPWEDFPSTNTPISADRLNAIEAGIDAHAYHPIVYAPGGGSVDVQPSWAGKTVIIDAADVTFNVTPDLPNGMRVDFFGADIGKATFSGSGVTVLAPGGESPSADGYGAATLLCLGAHAFVVGS